MSGFKFPSKALTRLLSARGTPFEFVTSERGTFVATFTIGGKVAGKVKGTADEAGKQKLTLKLSKKLRRKLGRARRLKVAVRIDVTDLAGNQGTAARPDTEAVRRFRAACRRAGVARLRAARRPRRGEVLEVRVPSDRKSTFRRFRF